MTEKAGLPLDMAVFCLQSSVILTFICVIDSNCVRFYSRSSLLAITLSLKEDTEGVLDWHQQRVDKVWVELLEKEQRSKAAVEEQAVPGA